MNLTERNPIVIGAVAIVLILAGTIAALTIKGDTFAPGYPLSANFRDSAGLVKGDRVTIAGVPVGHVGGIKQQGDSVLVSLKMNHGVQVARGTTAAIKVATLLGRRAVALTAPRSANWHDIYRKGEHLPALGSSPTEVLDVQADAQTALATLDANALNGFLADLAQVTDGKRTQVSAIIDGLNKLTATVNSRQSQITTLIDAANAVSATVESRNQNLLTAIDKLDAVVANLDTRRTQLTQLLQTTQDAASRISGLIGKNRAKLDAVLTTLQTDLAVINQHQVDLAQSVSYLAGSVEGFSSVGYSGPQNTPNTWANIYTVGVGPAAGDPLFGCQGELGFLLNQVIGPDPVTSCKLYKGPIPGTTAAGASTPARPSGTGLRPGVPGSATPPTAKTTQDSLNALLVPILSGGPR